MKNIARLLFSLMLALTFVFSTMLQFHHHDCAGNIFIYLTGIGEIELSSHSHHHFGESCCGHAHNSDDANTTHGENLPQQAECPMHLDETIVVDDHIHYFIFKAPAFHLIQAIIPVALLFDFQPQEFFTGLRFLIKDTGTSTPVGFSKSISHRGPPYFVS